MFFRLILQNETTVLLGALYRPQWQGSGLLAFLTDPLDSLMASHGCQKTVIVGDLNHHLVNRAFTELTVVHGLTNHINFATHIDGASLTPSSLIFPETPCTDHHAVLCELGINPACEEGRQRTIWLWDQADWNAVNRIMVEKAWGTVLAGTVDQNVEALTSTILSAQAQHVPHRTYRTDPRDQSWDRMHKTLPLSG